MIARQRLERLHRLRMRLREHASDELARRAAALATLDGQIAAVRDAEDAARGAAGVAATGAGIALGWGYADGLARRATLLATAQLRAATQVEVARDVVRGRRRDEEQLARLGRRVGQRADEVQRRSDAVHLDELARSRHGRQP